MITIYSEQHKLRDAASELYGGQLVKPFESPSRAELIVGRVRKTGLGEVRDAKDFGIEPILNTHDAGFVEFLQHVSEDWRAAGFKGEAIPTCWPARRMAQKIPDHIEGKMGYYAMAAETAISPGTWEAAYASAQVALTAAEIAMSEQNAAFALCRPPGHHAGFDLYGGYCFLNNAAIAAQFMLDQGVNKVAILDIDFHHGNGTQDIFYQRGDVLFASLHGDPRDAFPHFLGYADETGEGPGAGTTINYPMKPGTGFVEWRANLADAIDRIGNFAPDAMVISLGVDTFENDPISFFKLKSEDYLTTGADIASLKLPTLFVMEGGYDVEEIGVNAVNVLQGFESGLR